MSHGPETRNPNGPIPTPIPQCHCHMSTDRSPSGSGVVVIHRRAILGFSRLSSAMSKQRLEPLPNKLKGRPSVLEKPVPTMLSSPSHSSLRIPIPPPSLPSAEPSSSSTFNTFLGSSADTQTVKDVVKRNAYNGLKGLLEVINTVGYALPPLKAAAAGLSSVLMFVEVCTPSLQWVTV